MNYMLSNCRNLNEVDYDNNFVRKDGLKTAGMFENTTCNRSSWLN